ncbi:MAG: hypothetical protein REI09_02645 [Candidatus Dactylopiibacterium sp.]|nr:hypothetical protein [Candidatus Dactylopiibacterium sp.]
MTRPGTRLYERSQRDAERYFYIVTGIALVCGAFVYFVSDNRFIAGLILAFAAWHIVGRLYRGAPVGIPMLEVADDFLWFRNRAIKPIRVDRIALDRLHSVELEGEEHLRYFNCKLMNGDTVRIGPFERGQGELAIAEWFYQNLPDTPFHVNASATPMQRMDTRPPGL